MDNDKIITFEIPKGYKYRQRVFDKFVFEKMNDRPTDIIEALEILDLSMLGEENYRRGQLYALQQLLIYRDAWWKMADDWKPDWNNQDDCYHAIKTCKNEVCLVSTLYLEDCILAFPTAEMRDEFYNNFKDLIEQCKELL